MLTEKHYPIFLSDRELDEYLAKGWYRMNQMIFTCHFIYFNEGIYSPVWIRLDLIGFKFKKRLRKILNRNARLFNVSTQKAKINIEKEILFQLYKTKFKGKLANSLEDSLLDSSKINIYNTHEICVYKGDQLIAVSFFDIGAESIASIIGIYHPDYAQYSLGFYTMLLEIKWSLANDKKYYYPGYVIPDRPRFDYKLRIGDVAYYDPKDQHWKDWNKFDLHQLPINLLESKYKALSQFLNQAGIPHQKIFYPLFEEELIEYQGERFIKLPILLSCFHRNENLHPLILEYDLMKACYRLSYCSAIDNHLSVYTSDLASRYGCDLCCLSFLYESICLLETNNFKEIKKEILFHKQQL